MERDQQEEVDDGPFPSPCGVNIVGNTDTTSLWDIASTWFPSPCGVNIVGNEWAIAMTSDNSILMEFPSPCGVNIVGNYKVYRYTEITTAECFRPLAG